MEISATLRTAAVLLCLTALSRAQTTYTQATYISTRQFCAGLKEVSLDLRSDPSLAKFVSPADQRADIVIALAAYGIAIRPGSQVTLVVTATHHDDAIQSRNVTTGQVEDTNIVHGIYFNLQFYLKAAALRNGRLHLVMVAPAVSRGPAPHRRKIPAFASFFWETRPPKTSKPASQTSSARR